MCWNESVSLNTFLFTSFVLLLIAYNNFFTKYKIPEFNNKWMYFFVVSFTTMQLLEFFIWRNLDNKKYNSRFSLLAFILVHIQPAASIMLLTNIPLRNLVLTAYLLIAVPHLIYSCFTTKIIATRGEGGHLSWNFNYNYLKEAVWAFFFSFSFIYERKLDLIIFGSITLSIAFVNYYRNHNVVGSMWCWSVNSLMIYYATYLLMYLPFLEKMSIC